TKRSLTPSDGTPPAAVFHPNAHARKNGSLDNLRAELQRHPGFDGNEIEGRATDADIGGAGHGQRGGARVRRGARRRAVGCRESGGGSSSPKTMGNNGRRSRDFLFPSVRTGRAVYGERDPPSRILKCEASADIPLLHLVHEVVAGAPRQS